MKKVWMWMLTLAMLVGMCACTAGGGENSPDITESADDYGTVVVDNNGREITFTKMPQRVISMNIQTTEMMLALGLGDKLIGTSYNNCQVLPEYQAEFDRIPILSDTYASHEVIIDQEPDFVIGRNTAFREKSSGTLEQFAAAGIPVYEAKGTVVSGRPEVMEDVYEDIRSLGKIFKVEEKAEALIGEMEREIEEVQEALSSVQEPLKVLVIDSLDGNEIFTASNALESELIRLAGGQNIAPDMGSNWATISMEVATDANPDIIVFNIYEETTLEEKIAAAEAVDALRDTNAVKNKRYVGIPLTSVHESIRTADTVRYLAEQFYPELFQ